MFNKLQKHQRHILYWIIGIILISFTGEANYLYNLCMFTGVLSFFLFTIGLINPKFIFCFGKSSSGRLMKRKGAAIIYGLILVICVAASEITISPEYKAKLEADRIAKQEQQLKEEQAKQEEADRIAKQEEEEKQAEQEKQEQEEKEKQEEEEKKKQQDQEETLIADNSEADAAETVTPEEQTVQEESAPETEISNNNTPSNENTETPGTNYSENNSAPAVTQTPQGSYGQGEVCIANSGNGKKYHNNSNCSNMDGNVTWMSKDEAINRGYGPCKRCYK